MSSGARWCVRPTPAPRSRTPTATISNCANGSEPGRLLLPQRACDAAVYSTLQREENHAALHAGQLQDLPVGSALGDPAAREEQPVRVPPYRKRQPARLVPRDLAAQEGAGIADRQRPGAVRVER